MKQKRKKSFGLLTLFVLLFISMENSNAQVTIGSSIEPQKGTLLELTERVPSNPVTDNSTSDRGFLFPRVKLTDKVNLFPMFEQDGNDGYKIGSNKFTKSDEDKAHTGLIVYNVSPTGDFSEGLYIWNGDEWRYLDNSPVIQPGISSLVCNAIEMSPNKYTKDQPFSGILKVPYMEGNGGTYQGIPKTEIVDNAGANRVKGLYIELSQGRLAPGGGEIQYNITGIPDQSSPETIDFEINFLGQTCPVSVGSGVNTLGLRSLERVSKVVTPRPSNGNPQGANLLKFEEIVIPSTGSYAFSLRLYGLVGDGAGTSAWRNNFYIYLLRLPQNKTATSDEIMVDNAEIDLVTNEMKKNSNNNDPFNPASYADFSYSVSLGGSFEAGDRVLIRMYGGGTTTWTLKNGGSYNPYSNLQADQNPNPDYTSPVRTSLVFWKL